MKWYLGVGLCLGLWSLAATALAQAPYGQRSVYDNRPDVQQQPIPPEVAPPQQPVFQRRENLPQPGPNPQQPPAPPFQLTPQEQAAVDRVLDVWEQRSAQVKTFECQFARFEYNKVFGPADKPIREDRGELKFASPDKGLFRIDGQQPEQWICDGKSIFQFDYQNKKIIEHKLPPQMQGAAIADGPIPFLFGAKAQTLKERYFLKIVTRAENANKEVWILAYPRRQQEKENFDHAQVILSLETMLPTAIQLIQVPDKNWMSYAFGAPRVNPIDPLKRMDPFKMFSHDPFRPVAPGRDWTHVVEEPPRQANNGGNPPQLQRR